MNNQEQPKNTNNINSNANSRKNSGIPNNRALDKSIIPNRNTNKLRSGLNSFNGRSSGPRNSRSFNPLGNKLKRNNSIGNTNPNSIGKQNNNKDDVNNPISNDSDNNRDSLSDTTSQDDVGDSTKKVAKSVLKVARKLVAFAASLPPLLIFSVIIIAICAAIAAFLVVITPVTDFFGIDLFSNENPSFASSFGSSPSVRPSTSTSTDSDSTEEVDFTPTNSNTGYWWPIGSIDVTITDGKKFASGEPRSTSITSTFAGNDSTHRGAHGAIDISAIVNYDNVIATNDGTVIYPTENDRIDYPNGWYDEVNDTCSQDGGGFGNYVKIDHGNGLISIYGHMYANTITVRKGDTVKKGQVIGLSGTSGCSTGGHLHFEFRLNGTKVDPLEYVSVSNPRW